MACFVRACGDVCREITFTLTVSYVLPACRFMKHQLRTLEVLCPEKDCGNVCPACPVVS